MPEEVSPSVQVTAHRGSSCHAPENTLSAIRRAIADGADYAEIDVQETADGVIVVMHDPNLLRTAGLDKPLWEMTYAQLRDLEVGSWFSQAFHGEPIPTLEEVIALARGHIKLNIELKFNGHERRLPERVVHILAERHFAKHCVVTSLAYDGLQRVKSLDSRLRIGYIVETPLSDLTRLNVDFLSVKARLATRKLVRLAKLHGLGVHVWTVNEPQLMASMIAKGVENIITDCPDRLVKLLQKHA